MRELRKLVKKHLYVEGDAVVDEHSVRVSTDDDELPLAYFFLDQCLVDPAAPPGGLTASPSPRPATDDARMPRVTDSTDFGGVRFAYDTVAQEYATRFPDTGTESPLDLAMVDAFAAAVVAGGGTSRVLGAGCGTARISRYLSDRGCRAEGVDLSPGMISMAFRNHPDLPFSVHSLTSLPFPDDTFDGVLLWYSIIHTPPAGQARIFAEAARVLRPGGHLLVGFQHGQGPRDVGELYKALGFDVELERHNYTADEVAARVTAAGLHEVCRMVRRGRPGERDDQASVLARAPEVDV